jgi:hypothetical protein
VRDPAKLVNTNAQKEREQFDLFSALVQRERLDKIERSIGITSPNEDFRSWLIKVLWYVDQNSKRGVSIRGNRAALKKELCKSASLAEKLRASAELIWKSNEPSVLRNLRDFVAWQEWQSSLPMHPSGVGWIAALDEFANRSRLLANILPDDAGGPKSSVMFDDLLIVLTEYFTALARKRKRPIDVKPIDKKLEREFFNFIAAVTEVARNVWKDRPAAKLKVPPTDQALRERLRRLTLKSLAG